MCVAVDKLDYMRCQCKSKGTYMPNMCKKRNHFVDSGIEVRVRCGKKEKIIYVLKIKSKLKLQSLTGDDSRMLLCQIDGRKIKVFVDNGLDVRVRRGGKRQL